jgi:hypothetical protein
MWKFRAARQLFARWRQGGEPPSLSDESYEAGILAQGLQIFIGGHDCRGLRTKILRLLQVVDGSSVLPATAAASAKLYQALNRPLCSRD